MKQARVDEYLHWQQLNTRIHGSMYFRVRLLSKQSNIFFQVLSQFLKRLFLEPIMKTGKPSDDRDLEAKLRKNVEDVLTKVGENCQCCL